MKKLTVITIVFALIATVAVILMRTIAFDDTHGMEALEMKLNGLKSGIAVESGKSISDVYLTLPISVKLENVISVSSDTSIAYLKPDPDPIEKRVYKVEVVAVSEGIAEVYFRSSNEDFETEKYEINVIGNNITVTEKQENSENLSDDITGTAVFVTKSGSKYHLSESCAGDGGYAISLTEAVRNEYSPCKNCAMSE